MGGEKSTQTGNVGTSTETSDDTFLNCQGLWLENVYFSVVAQYTLATVLCKHVFFKDGLRSELTLLLFMYQFPRLQPGNI